MRCESPEFAEQFPPAAEQWAQYPLHHRPQWAVLPDKSLGPDAQQLIDVLLHQAI